MILPESSMELIEGDWLTVLGNATLGNKMDERQLLTDMHRPDETLLPLSSRRNMFRQVAGIGR